MRSKLFLTLAILVVAANLVAQVTLTSAYFPRAGDTLKTSLADTLIGIDLLTPGPDRDWDFGDVTSSVNFTEAVRDNTGDTLFPSADVQVSIDALNVGYYQISDTAYSLVGLRGRLEIFPDFETSAPVAPGRSDRRAPLNYEDSFITETDNTVTIAREELPVEILAQFGSTLATADSLRLSVISSRRDRVDAYGSLTLNGTTYQVLRERRSEVLETRVFVQSGNLPFIDVTGVIPVLAPEAADLVGVQPEVVTYYYWSPDSKEPIATVVVDANGEPSRMTYKRDNRRTSSTGGPTLVQATAKVYPNPAHGMATFELSGLERGDYQLRVINLLGKVVTRKKFPATGNVTKVAVDVSALPFGTYLYSIGSINGRVIATKKLLIGR